MAKVKDCPGFETFGADVKEARKAKNLARKDLAEKLNNDRQAGEIFQSRGHARGKRAAPAGRTEVKALPGPVFAYRGGCH